MAGESHQTRSQLLNCRQHIQHIGLAETLTGAALIRTRLSVISVASCCIFTTRSSTSVRICFSIFCVLLLALSANAQSPRSMAPQVVEFPSGNFRLTAYL